MYYNQTCKINSMFSNATDPYYQRDKYCLLNCNESCKRKTELQDMDAKNKSTTKWFWRKIEANHLDTRHDFYDEKNELPAAQCKPYESII